MKISEGLKSAADAAESYETNIANFNAAVTNSILELQRRIEALEKGPIVSPPPPPPPPPPATGSRRDRGRAFLQAKSRRGVNVTNWLDSPSVWTAGLRIDGSWGGRWEPPALANNIANAGFDHVRLGVRPLRSGGTTEYHLGLCRRFVDAATEEGLTVWITGFQHGDDIARDPQGTINALRPEWRKYVSAFKSYTNVHYEPINEPQNMNGRVLYEASRALYQETHDADPDGWVAYSPEAWSTVYAFEDDEDPIFEGERVVMVGHNYEPLAFTHSAEDFDGDGNPSRPRWTGGDVTVANVVYGRPVSEHIRQLDGYARQRDVALWMNEWGVIRNGSISDARRAVYYKSFREELERQGIAWATFDWGGGFDVSNGATLLPGFRDALGL